jgi:hypothetical protein
MNKQQTSAKLRAEKELQENPEKYKELGRKGGLAKVPKGFAKLTPERRQEIVKQSLQARARKGLISQAKAVELEREDALSQLSKPVADFLS